MQEQNEQPVDTSVRVRYFPDLDGWRFVAFLLVFVSHGFPGLSDRLKWGPSFEWIALPLRRLLHSGDTGVAFFFVLSGFLITYLILREIEDNGRLDVLRFYMRRTLRIWPLYFAVVAFALLVYPALKSALGYSSGIDCGAEWRYWLFLSNLDVIDLAGRGAMMTNITWSVAIEEQFYLAWPLIFLLVPGRCQVLIFPAVILQSLVFRAYHVGDSMVLYFHTFSVAGDLALGGMLAYLVLNCRSLVVAVRSLPRWSIGTAYTAGALLILYQSLWTSWAVFGLFSRVICGLFFCFVILEQTFGHNSLFKMSAQHRLTRWGRYTYGLYLLHPIAIQLCLVSTRLLRLDARSLHVSLLSGATALSISFGMAAISYHWYERQFLRWKDLFKPTVSDVSADRNQENAEAGVTSSQPVGSTTSG